MSEDPGKKLGREFLDYYLSSSLPNMRAGLLITILLFVIFAVSNRIIFGDAPEQYYFLRFGIILPYLLFSLLATFVGKWRPHLHDILFWTNIVLVICVFLVGATSDISDPGYEYYFSWVMLVIVGTYTFYRIRFWNLVLIGGLMLTAYILATVVNQSYKENLYLFINNLFFIISISSLGFFIAFILKKINQKDYLHQKALSEQYQKLIDENKERRKAEAAMVRSEHMYHTILEAIPDWIYLLSRELRIIYINPSLRAILEESGWHTQRRDSAHQGLHPLMNPDIIEDINRSFRSDKPFFREERYKIGEKQYITDTALIPIHSGGEVSQVLAIIRDKSREREIEELKLRNAEQKEIMLREIHHRVKNNLAIVISLLGLQYNNNPIPDLQRIIRDIELRIRSMALIHEHLYRSENLDRIPLDAYLLSLAQIIQSTYSGKQVHLQTRLEPMDVSIETALPLGLIANELLTNAFKYAFIGRDGGEITITLEKREIGLNLLIVEDNGVGLPAGITLENQNSLGMFIIKLLSEQLDGKVKISNPGGARFTVYFSDLMSKSD